MRIKRGVRIAMKWHHRAAAFSIGLAFIHMVLGISSTGMTVPNKTGIDNIRESRQTTQRINGEKVYNTLCRRCHLDGGNIIIPGMPLRGSPKLVKFETFLRHIRDPRMPDGSRGPMPAFSDTDISDKQAKDLYQYIISRQGLNALGKSIKR
jgi:hypothetical protein